MVENFEAARERKLENERQIMRDADLSLGKVMSGMNDLIDRFRDAYDRDDFSVCLDDLNTIIENARTIIASTYENIILNDQAKSKLVAYLRLLSGENISTTSLRRMNRNAVPELLTKFVESWAQTSVSETYEGPRNDD
jgi:hypothetical protein